ncbi:LOB domain-containing protein 1-like [Actinidia eriantha]|uniref:LOB domain-containing protein 1-like n=1 Tax=Actinidia eriantha TaxID=165200 RepID=UPI00258A5128|nr:LOB domain-containing protein 1-like [Actinidia eriantha]
MGNSDNTTATTVISSHPYHSPSPNSLSSNSHHKAVHAVVSPCAACKILRRRCGDKCVLAPYFPPTDPLNFTIAHRVFGASNIIKLLQELPESHRADAVSSIVYEANARLRDPVYGCAGVVCQLQKQLNELQAQLAKAQAELANIQCQQANLATFICMEMEKSPQPSPQQQKNYLANFVVSSPQSNFQNCPNFGDDQSSVGSMWMESLWT